MAGIVGIAGLPPVPTALGRALLPAPLAACSVLTGGLIAARFAVAAWQAYGVVPTGKMAAPERDPTHWFLIGPALALAAAAFGLGALPWSGMSAAISEFADPHTIVDALLHHPLPVLRSQIAEPSVATVLLLAAATILLGAAAAAARPAARKTTFVHRLHDIHNGSVGNYVAWLASGVAAITGTFVLLR